MNVEFHDGRAAAGYPRALAVAMVAAPIVGLVGALLVPPDGLNPTLNADAALTQLNVVADNRTAMFWGISLIVVSMFCTVPAMIGVIRLARSRGRALVTIGGVITAAGSLCGAVMLGEGAYVRIAATNGMLERRQAAEWLSAASQEFPGSPQALFVAPFLLGTVIGSVLVAVGLLRGRFLPWWLPVLLAVGLILQAIGPGGWAAVLFTMPVIVSLTLLAARLVRDTANQSGTVSVTV
jgi:hypothetical protein